MRKIALALAMAGAMGSLPGQADTFGGLYLGAQGWQMQAEGSFGSHEDGSADFDFEDNTQGVFYVALEHPIFLLPNVKLRYNDISASGDAVVSNFTFGGQTYNGAVKADVDLTHTDIILYYEVLDNSIIGLDLGVNVKYLDGELAVVGDVSGTPVTGIETLSAPLPMAYLKAEVGLPLTGLSTFGEISYLGYSGNTLSDYQIGVAYQFIDNMAIDMNIHAGYRAINLELDDVDDVDADLEFSGAFAGVEIHF